MPEKFRLCRAYSVPKGKAAPNLQKQEKSNEKKKKFSYGNPVHQAHGCDVLHTGSGGMLDNSRSGASVPYMVCAAACIVRLL